VVIEYVLPVVVLQVTDNLVLRELSSNTNISLLAVTAVVFTVTVPDPAAITTPPALAAAHTAGAAELAQLVAVAIPGLTLITPAPLDRISPEASAVGKVQVYDATAPVFAAIAVVPPPAEVKVSLPEPEPLEVRLNAVIVPRMVSFPDSSMLA
jgi:hypothetical protein